MIGVVTLLDESWPPFLDQLKSNPKDCARQFCLEAMALLRASPPRIMRSLNQSERDDLIQEIVLHCIRNRLKVLKSYRDDGRPFAVWLYMISRNKAMDYLRSRGREAQVFTVGLEEHGADTENPDVDRELRRKLDTALEVVDQSMAQLDQKCRILLRYAADEYAPREIARALGLEAGQAKKISDDIRQCRKKLRNLVETQGVKLDDLFA